MILTYVSVNIERGPTRRNPSNEYFVCEYFCVCWRVSSWCSNVSSDLQGLYFQIDKGHIDAISSFEFIWPRVYVYLWFIDTTETIIYTNICEFIQHMHYDLFKGNIRQSGTNQCSRSSLIAPLENSKLGY